MGVVGKEGEGDVVGEEACVSGVGLVVFFQRLVVP